MKTNRIWVKALSVLLAVCLLVSLCPTAFAAEGEVAIGTLDELTAFARACSMDSYSKELHVVLTADIDAAGAQVSIPVFSGTFDGQGHSITNLTLTESSSDYGLFSQLDTGAMVRDLNVEGEIRPSGTQSAVGGIAGRNRGTIDHCSFSGTVNADGQTGGIVGYNEASGTVVNCTVSGAVQGVQSTGGIVGQNVGTVSGCTNSAAVNTDISDALDKAEELDQLENSVYDLLKNEDNGTEYAVTTDTGGIVGYSTGVVQSCTNSGPVGYPHVGYNVGGIAGRQSGYMASCVNQAAVQGRKDVGGIVGQMAPDVTLQIGTDGLDELRDALNTLQSLIDSTLATAQSASDSVSGRVSRISGYADTARTSASNLAGQIGDTVSANVATIDSAAQTASGYIGQLSPILSDLSSAGSSAAQADGQFKAALDQLDDSSEVETLLEQLKRFCDASSAACSDLTAAADALDRAFSIEIDGVELPDTSDLRRDLSAWSVALDTLNSAVSAALDEYESTGVVSAETWAAVRAAASDAVDCTSAVANDLSDLMGAVDWNGLVQQGTEVLRQFNSAMKDAASALSSATGHLGSAFGSLADAADTIRTIKPELDSAGESARAALASTQQSFASLSGALSGAAQWTEDVSNEPPVSVTLPGDEMTASSDALNASLSGISSELSALNGALSNSSTALISDVRAVNNQFMKVMNLFLNLLNETQNVDYSDYYEDVSDENIQSATRGKVTLCENYGAVEADRNVGGVAGSMAIEYDLDPEDDLRGTDQRSTRFTYQTKAILLDCASYGGVKARKSCAGGVVGRMDLGTVSGCGGWGSVKSENGDYVGGVCGLSISSIRQSYAKCLLSGRSYVGGIAGSGRTVTDCRAMVEITDATQLSGAIAGEITGTYTGNYFVSDTLAGVDRVSYEGKAEPLSYEALCALDGLPDTFHQLSVTFTLDDEVVECQYTDYGAALMALRYPDTPEKEGYYVQWTPDHVGVLLTDIVISGSYEPYVTTLASEQLTDSQPSILVQGDFRNGDAITAEAVDAVHSGDAAASWVLTIPDDGAQTHTVRWRIPEGAGSRFKVYASDGETVTELHSWQSGSYLCFDLAGNAAFTVVAEQYHIWQLVAIGGGALCAAVVIVLCVRRKRR